MALCVFFQFKILSLNFLRVTAASGDFYGSDRIGRRGSHCSYAGAVRARDSDSLSGLFSFSSFFPRLFLFYPSPALFSLCLALSSARLHFFFF